MTITYRNNKGTALTYDEVDENIRDLYKDTTIDRVLGNGNTTTKNITVGDLTSTGTNISLGASTGTTTINNKLSITGQPWIYFRPSRTTSVGYVNQSYGLQQQGSLIGTLANNATYGQFGITIPIAGVYLMTWQTICANTGSRVDTNLKLNLQNLTSALSEDSTTGNHQRTHIIAYKLVVNDFISLYNGAWYNAGSDPGEWSNFSMYLLG